MNKILTMRNEDQGLTVGNGSPVMTDLKEGHVYGSNCNENCVPVMAASSSDVVNSAVDNSEVVPCESVEEAISKEVAQETARRQYQCTKGLILMVLFRELMQL